MRPVCSHQPFTIMWRDVMVELLPKKTISSNASLVGLWYGDS